MPERIGYDELLSARVRQLQQIDERLAAMLRTPNGLWDWESTKTALHRLRRDIGDMIRVAKAESDAFESDQCRRSPESPGDKAIAA